MLNIAMLHDLVLKMMGYIYRCGNLDGFQGNVIRNLYVAGTKYPYDDDVLTRMEEAHREVT